MLETLVLVNREAALDRVGGDEELLTEIARLFLEDSVTIMADIRSAIAFRDATKLEHSAHSLKGSVANFGADPVRDAAFALEQIGRSRDLSKAPAAFAELENVYARLLPELEALAK